MRKLQDSDPKKFLFSYIPGIAPQIQTKYRCQVDAKFPLDGLADSIRNVDIEDYLANTF